MHKGPTKEEKYADDLWTISLTSIASREKQFFYWNIFSVHRWYPPLKDFTFETRFIDLSYADCVDFIAYQNKLLEDCQFHSQGESKPLPPCGSERLERIERELEEAVNYFIRHRGRCGAFVKLSDRSPKDATTERGRILDFLPEPLQRYTRENPDVNSSAVGLPAIYEAMMGALRVRSGREALQLLLTSFRTMEDLQFRMQYVEKLWEMKIAVREWVEFPLPYEFRGFVSNGTFNALSQYYYDCYFPNLVKHRDWIERSIRNYWQTLAPKVPYDAYVIDFVVMKIDESLPHNTDLPVKVIELNPFDESADSALFKWAIHKRVLTEGPWTFRIVTKEELCTQRKTWWKKARKASLVTAP